MAVELKEINFDRINFETEVINNLFQKIERLLSKREEVVPFKGGLPRVPLVVGLIGKLPSGINNLIAKFIGFQSKPATELKSLIESAQTRGEIGRGEKPNQSYLFTPRQVPEYYVSRLIFYLGRVKRTCYIDEQYRRLKRLRAEKRKSEFLKLRRWVRKELIINEWCTCCQKKSGNSGNAEIYK